MYEFERMLEKLLNKYLDEPLYAQFTDVIDMYDSFAIYQKRSWWFSKEVAEISRVGKTMDFKVIIKEKRWADQIKTAAEKVTGSSPFQLTVHD